MSRLRKLFFVAAAAGAVTAGLSFAQSTGPQPGTTAPAAGRLGLGRLATPEEIAGWAISVRPDGQGLPPGRGTVKEGEALYVERCASCHGEFGESAGRWPILSGGAGTLPSPNPVKSIGSYWPYASTVLDYIRRTMPYGNAQSLTDNELYAVTAYVLYLNDVITEEDFELSQKNFPTVKLPNESGFYDDDREVSEKAFWNRDPCMANCKPGNAKVTNRARTLDVTPEPGKGPKVD